ncbi:prepilin-type N-terminal cleavage/methylation domain-containing protein [Cupriavidus basilensis]
MHRTRLHRRSKLRKGQGGFTIIELLIASTLTAIGLSAGLWAARQEAACRRLPWTRPDAQGYRQCGWQ